MNRLTAYIYVILALSVCHGCVNIGLDIPEPSPLVEYPVLLNISGPDVTKITNSENNLEWEEDDIIQITAVADGIEQKDTVAVTDLQCFSIDEDNRSRASFSGFISLRNAPRDCYFTYPSGAAMTVDPSTGLIKANYTQQDGSHEPFLYAKVAYPQNPEDGIDLTMNHLGAVLKLDVQVEGVDYVSFIGNNLERLSPVLVDPDNHELGSPTEAVKQITVNVGPEGQDTYLFVPPVNLENGFSLIFSKEDGSYFIKSYSGSGENGGYDFSHPSKRGAMIPLTIDGQFENFSITATELSSVHTTKDNLLSGTSVSFKMSLTGSPDKLIDGWGADLYNSNSELVRTVSYDGSVDITNGQQVNMGTVGDWKLLPAGDYIFCPYYEMYGTKTTLANQKLTISDHGAYLKVEATTSYDKYISNKISDANSHAWNKIEGVKVKTNLHPDLIDSYSAEIYLGTDNSGVTQYLSTIDKASFESGVASYGDLTALSWGVCPLTAYIKCGNLELNASKDCHITGLPYVADFTTGNPSGWAIPWGMIGDYSYKSSKVVFHTQSALRSPAFYIPSDKNISISTSCACVHNVTSNSKTVDLNIAPCEANETDIVSGGKLSFGSTYYQDKGAFGDVSGFSNKGELKCTGLKLNAGTPSLMYSVSLDTYFLGANTFISFKYKIEYSN